MYKTFANPNISQHLRKFPINTHIFKNMFHIKIHPHIEIFARVKKITQDISRLSDPSSSKLYQYMQPLHIIPRQVHSQIAKGL